MFLTSPLKAIAGIAGLILFSSALAAAGQASTAAQTKATALSFADHIYQHRWSKNGQNEYTRDGDADLARWRDMVTINVHPEVGNGDQLASLANSVLGNYQKHGKIVRTDSKPRTAQQPAEHLIVALLGAPGVVEAAFARVMLVEGVGVVTVYSHRAYGNNAAGTVGDWVKTNGPSVEKALMTWDKMPPLSAVKALPQSK